MRKIAALCLVMVMTLGVALAQTATYEQLTSIDNIDETAQYVLGIDGTGFHYEGISSWGKTALPSAQTPIYYTLTKADDGESFTAQATIGGTTYYLQIPTTNTFSMATEAGTNTDLIIGTTQISETNYAVANKNNTARHLRINGTSGLRSYAGTTGVMAFFYKVVPSSGTTYTVTYYSNITGIDPIEQIYNEGATVTVADNTFVNPGYAFTEWNTEEDGTGDSYSPGDEIEDIAADIDLYAQWEQSSTVTFTYNFAGANNFYTDAALTTHPNSGSGNNVETIYYGDGSTFVASGASRYFSSASSGYFMLGKTDAAITLPTFDGYKITQVIVHTSGSVSTNVQVSVVSGSHTVSAAQKWATNSDFTYDIAADYQTSALSLKVTNNYNSQFTSITLICELDVPSTDPYITASDVDITYDAISGSIAYTIENEPSPAGTLTASTTADWLTLGTVTSEAVPFTCTENDAVVSRTATVTLTYTYDNNAVTKNIIVTQGVDATLGTADNPYTVAQARAVIDGLNGGTSTEKYVSGIISQIDSYNSNYSSITYWISDDGTTTNQLEVYSGKGINGAAFNSIDDIELTAEVVVKGNLKKYNTTYEFDRNNELVVYNGPQHDVEAPTFSPVAGTYAEAQTVTISCATEGADIYYTLDGTEPTMESTMYENPLTVSGTTTIKAVAYDGNDTPSNVTTATYHFCSADNPYTVTEALAFAEYQYPANGIYVSGIVSTAPTSLNNGVLTYYISVDGEATNELEVYKGKGLANAAFTSVDDIQVGDIVTIYGNVQVFNDVIEFGNGNYLVSFERPEPVLEEYDLTVSTLDEHINAIYVFNVDEPNDPLIEEGLAGTVQVLEGTDIMVSPDVEEGYVLVSLTVLDSEGESVQPENHMSDGGYYSFTMPSGPVTITATAVEAQYFELFSGDLVEGDYIIYYNGYAMKNTVVNGRLSYETVSPTEDVIATGDATIVWHIAPSATEDYWTIYSDDAQAYAASTGVKNKAQMLADTDDKALWSVATEEGTYEFTNKYNYDNDVNHLLRNNGNSGFACYAAATGGALSLYKKVEEIIDEPCEKILVDIDNPTWSETFEDDAEGITNPYTEILPECWTVVEEYTSNDEDVTPPQVYYNPSFNATDGGSYSLRMRYRSMLAMPELDEEVDFEHLKMGLYVRQSFWSYKLEIGVVTDIDNPDESYHLVATVNNPDKNVDYFECNFSSVNDLTGEGRYIVFKNVGGSDGDLYSNNYLDDITLTYVDNESENCQITETYVENFEDYMVGTEPTCWEVITEYAPLESSTRPQVYSGYNSTAGGNKSLRLKNRCIYAMPEFAEGYNVSDYTMTFQLRQPKSLYRLQVGVVDAQGEFTPVKTLKCNGTEFEEKTVNFSGYEGRIAFRNTLVPGTGRRTDYLDYSINYIDDIHFTSTEEAKIAANGENVLDTDLESIAVYPNPTKGELYIDAMGIQKVECYNQMGQLVRVYDNVVNTIDLDNLSEGVYMLRITVPQGVTMRKVVKR